MLEGGAAGIQQMREWPDVLSFDQLEQGRVFGSVQALTFRGWRS